uniref:Uncharacterized protein n=1 Tax=Cannabis sativa TaxID=3483 RepID=A0A803PS81_CANSA
MDIDDTVDDDGTQHSMFETQAKTIAVAVEYRALVERLDRLEKQQSAIIMSHAELLNNQTNEDDVYPEDWEHNDGEHSPLPTNTIITAIGDTQSHDDVLLITFVAT